MKRPLTLAAVVAALAAGWLLGHRTTAPAHRCTGAIDCDVCSDCSHCRHCNERGGSCGVCKPPTREID